MTDDFDIVAFDEIVALPICFLPWVARDWFRLQQMPSAESFFTVDLTDPSIAGAREEALLPAVIFSLERSAIRDVFVDGKCIVRGGRHHLQDEIVTRFTELQSRLGLWR